MENLNPQEILLMHIRQLHETLQDIKDPKILCDLSTRLVDAINSYANL